MGVVQKDMKHLKDREKTLDFFLSYLDISKLRLLQILNEKQEALNTIKTIKHTNSSFLDKINKNFFKDEKTFLESDNEIEELRQKEEVYFLVDAKEDDKYSEVMYKKLEETLAEKVKPNDLIITFGNKVNLIAQRLELNIVQHYPYDLYLDQNEFLNKVSSLIVQGFKNNAFTDATLIIVQQSQENNQLITRKLAPFNYDEFTETDYSKTVTIEVANLDDNRLNNVVDVDKMRQNSTQDYISFFQNINIKKMKWVPNINLFKFKLIEAIIKQKVIESRYIEEIQRLKLDIQLLDEKRNKLSDELIEVKRWVNRVRREKETESIIVLHSAFKLRNSQNNDLEIVRKKKEQDDLLVRRRGGAK